MSIYIHCYFPSNVAITSTLPIMPKEPKIQVTKILVTGGRDYADRDAVYAALDACKRLHPELRVIVHGAARGADTLAKEWALERGLDHEPYPADWDKQPRAAGYIRNQQMLVRSQPQAAVAFPGGRGTSDMVHRLRLAKVPVWEPYKFDIIPRYRKADDEPKSPTPV